MRKYSVKRIYALSLSFLILGICIGLVSPLATAGAESTSINLGSYTTYVGSNVTVPVVISNATDIAGGSAKISFNPSITDSPFYNWRTFLRNRRSKPAGRGFPRPG